MKQIILNHIDVEIWNNLHVQFQPHSDVNIIMGSTGSGKTTFLRNLYQSTAQYKLKQVGKTKKAKIISFIFPPLTTLQ